MSFFIDLGQVSGFALPMLTNTDGTVVAGMKIDNAIGRWVLDINLGTIVSFSFIPSMARLLGLSNDGLVISGNKADGNGARWSLSGGTHTLSKPSPGNIAQVDGASADGSRLVGKIFFTSVAAHWNSGGSDTEYVGSNISTEAFYASDDGTQMTGKSIVSGPDLFYRIFRWTSGGSYTDIAGDGATYAVDVEGITGDGNNIFGARYALHDANIAATPGNATVWDSGNIEHKYDTLPGAQESAITASSHTGNVYVGFTFYPTNGPAKLTRWLDPSSPEDLGISVANSGGGVYLVISGCFTKTSSDGQTIVVTDNATGSSPEPGTSSYWIRGSTAHNIGTMLNSTGTRVTDISRDGNVMVGLAKMSNGHINGFAYVITPPANAANGFTTII